MSIKEALAQIDANEQRIPSNPLANTGLGDAVTWDEVREWLAALKDHQPISGDALLANAWDEGEQAGAENHAAEEYPEIPTIPNPYRTNKVIPAEAATVSPTLFIGMKAYIWVEVFGMWQDAIWDGNVWRVADNDTVENPHVSKWVIQ